MHSCFVFGELPEPGYLALYFMVFFSASESSRIIFLYRL